MTDESKASLLTGVSDEQWDDMTRVMFALVRADDGALPTQQLLKMAKDRAPDPTIFEEREPYFFRAVASTYVIDSYFTRMDHLTTMKNFAADMTEGRALLVGHDTRAANLGMSLRGKYEAHGYEVPGEDKRVPWVWGDYYMLRGKEPQDSMIDAFRSGTQDRFSVGFSPGWWRCSVDGMDLFSYDCPHIPGRFYDAKTGKPVDDPSQGELAFADVVDAHQRELSTVYANATPGATLLKAQRMVEMGHIPDWKTVRHLEALYRHKMPGSERVYAAAVPPVVEEKPMPTEPTERTDGQTEQTEQRTPLEQLQGVTLEATGLYIDRAELKVLGLAEDLTASQFIELFKTHRNGAQQVQAYTDEAVNEAVHEAKRAMGEINEDRVRRMLSNLTINEIIEQRKDWAKQAAEIFKNGRQTQEQADLAAAGTAAEADRREDQNKVARRAPAPLGAYR